LDKKMEKDFIDTLKDPKCLCYLGTNMFDMTEYGFIWVKHCPVHRKGFPESKKEG